MRFDPGVLVANWWLFVEGALLTVQICVFAFLIAYAGAIPIALLKLSKRRFLRGIAILYIETLRNIPFIIILFLFHYGLPFVDVRLPSYVTGTLALSLFASAYYAEIIRAAILSVPRGQLESAYAIGMSHGQALREIIAPQMLRFLIPPSTNMTLTMIKESSVLSTITVPELTYQGLIVQGNTFSPFEVFVAVALLYWCFTALVALAARLLESRVGRAETEAVARNGLAARFLSLDRRIAT